MDNDNPSMLHDPLIDSSSKGYALSGKIMLSAIVVLFTVVVFMVGLHLYARWYLLRQRRHEILRRRRIHHRRTHIVFYVDNPTSGLSDANRGLEPSVLNSLPAFVYSSKTHPEQLECAVCLSEFEENENGRVLPKCNHSFHLECIDMWFHSHSTCPLCRSPVEPATEPDNNRAEVAVTVNEAAEPGSSSGLCNTCQHQEGQNSSVNTTSLGGRRKGLDLTGVRIEVPRNELEDDLEMGLRLSSPASQSRSPAARLLSLKRILSMNRKTPTGASYSPRAGTSCAAELDLESGGTQFQTRAQTPR
ncbi:RING-H2 finger protein ATL2-like [Nicotiana tabacum]|uniref:RING-type E3 ubiquitin transferase n=1 Tax=Nicotiana tabacum TaxID=4097 RepID=A0A1S3Z2M4_TOBAC|nr:RING-H2 finger protein ATL2-like [Nicotiana tomentosiformis]XP_016458679.1 PREDICTED: RING-H2 finger protein ATL2-like [Nicotiana tabacum]